MNGWIVLHHYKSGDEILVNRDYMVMVMPDQQSEPEGTIVQFPGEEQNFITVKESVDDIQKLLGGLENES